MKTLKYLGLILSFAFISSSVNAQVEVKVDPFAAALEVPMLSIEGVVSDNFGIETQFRYVGWWKKDISITTVGKYYIQSEKAAGLYLGVYGKYIKSKKDKINVFYVPIEYGDHSLLALGSVFGYKVEAKSIIVDFQAGLGRRFVIDGKYVGVNLDPQLSLSIGYRFGKKSSK